MPLGVGRGIGLHHLAIRADQHGNPRGLFLVRAYRRAISHGHRTVGIAQQFGGETDLVAPAFQFLCRAEGDAEENRIPIGEVLGSITEPIGFLGSAAAEGAREEPDQHVPSRIVREADMFPILIGQGKDGWCASDSRVGHRSLFADISQITFESTPTVANFQRHWK